MSLARRGEDKLAGHNADSAASYLGALPEDNPEGTMPGSGCPHSHSRAPAFDAERGFKQGSARRSAKDPEESNAWQH